MKIETIKGIALRKMMSAMSATASDLKPMLDDNVVSFYTGIPLLYNRTGELTNSPKVTEPTSGVNTCSVTMELDPGAMSHNRRKFSEESIIDVTNKGVAGVVGTPGYWDRAVENAKIIADSCFGENFSRK